MREHLFQNTKDKEWNQCGRNVYRNYSLHVDFLNIPRSLASTAQKTLKTVRLLLTRRERRKKRRGLT